MGNDVEEPEDGREVVLAEIFAALDQRRRGYVSRMELAHILDAMQADASVNFSVPEAMVVRGTSKDSRVTLSDLRKFLSELALADLEDVKWFAESVVKVEAELRVVWRDAVRQWRGRVERLYARNLHRYLLPWQPNRISRWLMLRTSMDETGKGESSIGLPGLGISQQEVDVLFTDETAEDIGRCSDRVEPFLSALDLRSQLAEAVLEGDCSQRCPPEVDAKVTELLTKLADLAERCRELACLLIHEDTLSFVTALVRTCAFSQTAVSEASKLIVALINYRVHEGTRDYESLCRQRAAEFLEIGFEPGSEFSLEAERRLINAPPKPCRMSLVADSDTRRNTVAEWVGSLLTLRADFDRGEMLDVLIKYDEKRLLLEGDGGDRPDESGPVSVSLFSFGRTVPYLLSRLDVSSHHSLHEHRTPMRTHVWKLLLNVLSSAGERGRSLFRAGEGMRVICDVIRGGAWGTEREEVTAEEEEDRYEEEEELYGAGRGTWGLKDSYHSWPSVEYFGGRHTEPRFYTMDFLDDKFYGSKDRMLAAAFLEYMASDAMWGEETLVEEMMQCPNTLQVLCRVRPPGCFLIRLLLSAPGFQAYLQATAQQIAEAYVERSLGQLCLPDATSHSLFPVCFEMGGPGAATGGGALDTFRREMVAVETKNVVLRILAFAYHSLQACLQEERSMREGDPAQRAEPGDEASQLEEEITGCCLLIASQLPLPLEDAGGLCVAIYTQAKEFTRKALLAVNQLPPVNPDERQRARGLEVAKTVPPRPMYFGHYQQLIYNQSNPTQPSSSSAALEGQARLKSLQGAADILFTGENRYLSEPSLFPYEFLVVLRLVQLLRAREPAAPPFLAELQDSLEQLTGHRSSYIFSDSHESTELADYPWRTGLAHLNTFRVSQVPLRRSDLSRFPRRCPLDVVRGLQTILKEYVDLNMWEEDVDGNARSSPDSGRRAKCAPRPESLAMRRSVLLALVFNHLCYFHPKMVTLEDSPQGLERRLGVSSELLAAVGELLLRGEPGGAATADESPSGGAGGSCDALRCDPGGAVGALQVSVGEARLAFVCMRGTWTLWANCTKDSAQVLTECAGVHRYFAFDASGSSPSASPKSSPAAGREP